MSSRNAVAAELQTIIEQIDGMCLRAERLATSSGGMVDPGRFRAGRAAMRLAAGDLDQKGLFQHKVPDSQPDVAP